MMLRSSSASTDIESSSPPALPPLRVLGICGGIGSGKSRACQLLVDEQQRQHAPEGENANNADDVNVNVVAHLEADRMAHAVYEPGSQALKDIVTEFGSQILNDDGTGTVNRTKLGAIVFSDPTQMTRLEHIVWPYVKDKIIQRIDELRNELHKKKDESGIGGGIVVVVLEAAVLLDADWDDIVDGVWVIRTPPSMAVERLVTNRGLTKDEAQKRIDAQDVRRGIGNLDDEVANGVVTKVIDNVGTEEDLRHALRQALHDPTAWKK